MNFNWSWLDPVCDEFKAYSNAINLFLIVDNPTTPKSKCPEKDFFIDLIIKNVPHKYKAASVFANGIIDHCCQQSEILAFKTKPKIIHKYRAEQLPERYPTYSTHVDYYVNIFLSSLYTTLDTVFYSMCYPLKERIAVFFAVELLPAEQRRLLKWKMSTVTPNIVKQTIGRSHFRVTKSKSLHVVTCHTQILLKSVL